MHFFILQVWILLAHVFYGIHQVLKLVVQALHKLNLLLVTPLLVLPYFLVRTIILKYIKIKFCNNKYEMVTAQYKSLLNGHSTQKHDFGKYSNELIVAKC